MTKKHVNADKGGVNAELVFEHPPPFQNSIFKLAYVVT